MEPIKTPFVEPICQVVTRQRHQPAGSREQASQEHPGPDQCPRGAAGMRRCAERSLRLTLNDGEGGGGEEETEDRGRQGEGRGGAETRGKEKGRRGSKTRAGSSGRRNEDEMSVQRIMTSEGPEVRTVGGTLPNRCRHRRPLWLHARRRSQRTEGGPYRPR